MAHIQATDRNLSDLEPMEELTDGELLEIKGGVPAAWAPPGYDYPSGWSLYPYGWYQHPSAWYQRPGTGIPAVASWWL